MTRMTSHERAYTVVDPTTARVATVVGSLSAAPEMIPGPIHAKRLRSFDCADCVLERADRDDADVSFPRDVTIVLLRAEEEPCSRPFRGDQLLRRPFDRPDGPIVTDCSRSRDLRRADSSVRTKRPVNVERKHQTG